MRLPQQAELRHQPAQAEGGERVDLSTTVPLAFRPWTRRRPGDTLERGLDVGEQRPALRRQGNPVAQAAEQRRRAEPFLQKPDLPADRAMGDAELRRGVLEARPARGRLERTDGIERRQTAGLSRSRHVSLSDIGAAELVVCAPHSSRRTVADVTNSSSIASFRRASSALSSAPRDPPAHPGPLRPRARPA